MFNLVRVCYYTHDVCHNDKDDDGDDDGDFDYDGDVDDDGDGYSDDDDGNDDDDEGCMFNLARVGYYAHDVCPKTDIISLLKY